MAGKIDAGRLVVVREEAVAGRYSPHEADIPLVPMCPGDYVAVQIVPSSSGTLHWRPLARTTIAEFYRHHGAPVADGPLLLDAPSPHLSTVQYNTI